MTSAIKISESARAALKKSAALTESIDDLILNLKGWYIVFEPEDWEDPLKILAPDTFAKLYHFTDREYSYQMAKVAPGPGTITRVVEEPWDYHGEKRAEMVKIFLAYLPSANEEKTIELANRMAQALQDEGYTNDYYS